MQRISGFGIRKSKGGLLANRANTFIKPEPKPVLVPKVGSPKPAVKVYEPQMKRNPRSFASKPNSIWKRLEYGHNRMRLFNLEKEFEVVWIASNYAGKRRFVSPCNDPDLIERLKREGFKPRKRYIYLIVDMDHGGIPKYLEVGENIKERIDILKKGLSSFWEYNICIERFEHEGSALRKRYCDVYTGTKSKSSKEERIFLDQFRNSNSAKLESATKPSDPNKIYEFMGWKREEDLSQYISADSNGMPSLDTETFAYLIRENGELALKVQSRFIDLVADFISKS